MKDAAPPTAIRGLIASNLLAIAIAYWQEWPLLLQLWPYWVQNLIVGWFSRKRILELRQFSTEGFRINGRAVDPTPETRRNVANFFVVHYGFFHVMYFVFLVIFTAMGLSSGPDGEIRTGVAVVGRNDILWMLPVIAAFWFSHRASYRQNLADDTRSCPNIGTLMFLPYARVLPMHLTIILAFPLGDAWGTLVFGGLKTGADVLMHVIEHRWMRSKIPVEIGGPTTDD